MIPGSANPLLLASAAGDYQVSRSLRFNSSDSGFCSRTPAVAGNRRTYTFSCWVKKCKNASADELTLLGGLSTASNNPRTNLYYDVSTDVLVFDSYNTSFDIQLKTSAVFRDNSAWAHVVLAVDTTQATSTNRVKLYVNNVEQTFGTTTYPSQNFDTHINAAAAQFIGSFRANTGYFNGYLADIHFIDGQALTPSSFTEVSATTGQLIPLAYSGSFGTNGFWLKFSDNSAATAATLGKDYSGNSNNWTPNNLSVTAGAGNDSLVDTPTSYGTDTGVGGEVRGNYATLNPLKNQGNTLGNGNLNITATTTSATTIVLATIGISSGKWYWEYVQTSMTVLSNGSMIGIAKDNVSLAAYVGYDANGWGYYGDGNKYNNNSGTAYGAGYSDNDVIGVAFDADAGTLVFYKNNASQGTAFSGLTSGPYFPAFSDAASTTVMTANVNFGQRAFAYPLSGFKALCDTNLGAPLVAKPNTLMDVALYTGNGGTQTISGLAFEPDFVWIKQRSSAATDHVLFDYVRGATKALLSDATLAELTNAQFLQSFDANGFTVGSDQNVNNNTGSFVAWCWDAGTSTVSNTAGSITSQVRANVSAGFSIVSYTGTGSTGTLGHGLGVKPQLLIVKSRTQARDWLVYHTSYGATQYTTLNGTGAAAATTSAWNNTEPTSTVFTIGNAAEINTNGSTNIAYCFSSVVGYSSISSYTGNGSTDGPFVYTGFRPRWVMIKRSDTSSAYSDWYIIDSARNTYNLGTNFLRANSSDPENYYNFSTGNAGTFPIDFLSNGFKYRLDNSGADVNANGGTYVFAAFAENPFQYARAR